MREVELWDIPRPADEAFEDMGPFGQNTMAFAQWLRWVFVPRVEALIAAGGPWPSSSQVHVVAMREGDTDAALASLVEPLSRFDALFVGSR
jgi:dTDP-4-dehydrorhamnose 3,5-epimerase